MLMGKAIVLKIADLGHDGGFQGEFGDADSVFVEIAIESENE